MDANGTLEFTVEAEYEVSMFVIDPICEPVTIVTSAVAPACTPTTIYWPGAEGSVYWLWVGPSDFTGPVTEFTYVMNVCGIIPVATEVSSWGNVKSLFR